MIGSYKLKVKIKIKACRHRELRGIMIFLFQGGLALIDLSLSFN